MQSILLSVPTKIHILYYLCLFRVRNSYDIFYMFWTYIIFVTRDIHYCWRQNNILKREEYTILVRYEAINYIIQILVWLVVYDFINSSLFFCTSLNRIWILLVTPYRNLFTLLIQILFIYWNLEIQNVASDSYGILHMLIFAKEKTIFNNNILNSFPIKGIGSTGKKTIWILN